MKSNLSINNFYQEVRFDEFEKHLDYLLDQLAKRKELKYHLYMFGKGGHEKGFYEKLGEYEGFEDVFNVICYGTIMSGFFKIFNFIPSHAGLIEIKKINKDEIKELFISIGAFTMVGLYGFRSQPIAEEFINILCEKIGDWDQAEKLAENDLEYFLYEVYLEHETEDGYGVWEHVVFGKNVALKIEEIQI
jgi:hypothetical protein